MSGKIAWTLYWVALSVAVQSASGGEPQRLKKPDLLQEYLQALGDGRFQVHENRGLNQSFGVGEAAKVVLRRAVAELPDDPMTELMLRHATLAEERSQLRFGGTIEELRRERRKPAGKPERVVERVYRVADLVDPVPTLYLPPPAQERAAQPEREKPDLDSLADLFRSTVQPTTWSDVGGPGSITADAGKRTMTVRQVDSVHREIRKLLKELRALGQIQFKADVTFIGGPEAIVSRQLAGKGEPFRPAFAAQPKDARMEGAVLLPTQAKQLLAACQKDSRIEVSTLSQFSVRNGQPVQIRHPAKNVAKGPPRVTFQPVVTSDKTFSRVTLTVGDRCTLLEVPNEPLDFIGIAGGVGLVTDVAPLADEKSDNHGTTQRSARAIVMIALRVVDERERSSPGDNGANPLPVSNGNEARLSGRGD